jgi:hypothetical protein
VEFVSSTCLPKHSASHRRRLRFLLRSKLIAS